MLNKIISASLALLLGWSGTAFAQTEEDALRYTRLGLSGSARIQGIGGAQAALGADVSSTFVNPAGLGMFRRSEITISPGFSTANANAAIVNSDAYFGSPVSDSRNALNIQQAGIVFSDRKGDNDGSDWRGTTIGLSITKLNNFNSRINYSGNTNRHNIGIAKYFAEQATNAGRTYEDLEDEYQDYLTYEGMAYGTYLINIVTDDQNVIRPNSIGGDSIAPEPIGIINFGEEILRKGSQNQFDLALGTSYRDKLYLGASVGIVTTNFSQVRMYRETETDASTEFTDLQLRDEYTTRGAGVNLKVGAIYRPIDAVRVGVSIQTPTSYSFDESYSTSLAANHTDIGNQNAVMIPGQFTYGLTTPFRATGGIAYFLNKYGFITADVEYVNYAGARFRESDSDYGSSSEYINSINTNIKNMYQSALNLKVGAEARYEAFRFRVGYAHGGDPYKATVLDGSSNTFTVGTGVRLQNFFVDLAYSTTRMDSSYSPYTFEDGPSPEVAINNELNNAMLTIGFNF